MKKLFLLLLVSVLFACDKENDAEPDETYAPCLITRIDETGGSYTTYRYDSNRRLASYYVYEVNAYPAGVVFEYNYTIERDSENRISKVASRIKSDNASKDTASIITLIEYDAQGRWIKSKFGHTSGVNVPPTFIATTYVKYNSEGLISTTTTNKPSIYEPYEAFFYSLAFEYEQENLIRSVFDFTPNSKVERRYEYYLDKEAKLTEVDLLRLITDRGSAPAGASPSKNLLKRITTDDKAKILDDYTYEFNEHGYPTKITNTTNQNRNYTTLVTDIT